MRVWIGSRRDSSLSIMNWGQATRSSPTHSWRKRSVGWKQSLASWILLILGYQSARWLPSKRHCPLRKFYVLRSVCFRNCIIFSPLLPHSLYNQSNKNVKHLPVLKNILFYHKNTLKSGEKTQFLLNLHQDLASVLSIFSRVWSKLVKGSISDSWSPRLNILFHFF